MSDQPSTCPTIPTISQGPSPSPFAPVWTNRRWLACAALLWLGCSAVYFLSAPGRIDMFDGGIRHDVTESIIDTGVPAVRDPWFPGLPGRWGLRYAWYELGSSVSAVPFVLVGRRLGHGSLEAKQFAFSMTSVPFAAAAVALVFLIYGRMGCSVRRALAWALVVAFCTLLWPYAGSSFDAALQAFWLTLAVWAAIEARAARSYRWAALSGAAFAMLIQVQEAYLVLAGCTAATFPLTLDRVREKVNDRLVHAIGAGTLVGVALIFAANVLRYGNPLQTGRDITSGMNPVFGNPVIGLAGLLISPAKSIFLYSPTVVIALIGLRRLLQRNAELLAPIPGCIVIHLALISSFRFWAGEWAWGPRYLVATIPLVCVGLPFAWPAGRRLGVKALFCGAGLIVQLLATSVDHQRYYFERSLMPYFWIDESKMYLDSPLFARPSELVAILERSDVAGARALVPGPRPLSMTSSIFGPGVQQLKPPQWMRQYLVFLVPRPWPLWSLYIGAELRPGATGVMTAIGSAVAFASFGCLFALAGTTRVGTGGGLAGDGDESAVAQSEEAEEEAR
jgi:hypothetical protein